MRSECGASPGTTRPIPAPPSSEPEWELLQPDFDRAEASSSPGVHSAPLGVSTSSMRESKVTVKIPRPLFRKIQEVVDDSGFNSPTDFIVFVLRDLMSEAESSQSDEWSQDHLDEVKRKLKNLGYL